MPDEDPDSRELYEDRAAIMQYDDDLPRYDAEFYSLAAAWRYCAATDATEPNLTNYRLVARHFNVETTCELSEKRER